MIERVSAITSLASRMRDRCTPCGAAERDTLFTLDTTESFNSLDIFTSMQTALDHHHYFGVESVVLCEYLRRGKASWLMRRNWTVRIVVVVLLVAVVVFRFAWRRHPGVSPRAPIPDLSTTSPLNVPGGGVAPAEAYEVYSALYQERMPEQLVFSDESVTDIPQVNGSCLQPSTRAEGELTDAFVAANRQSHRWEERFAIPAGYTLLSRDQAGAAQQCLETHFRDAACAKFRGIQHVRFLGVPGFDAGHTHALVSVVKMCGSFCGSGGIFAVEKAGGTWRRSAPSAFTRECSWMY
jgi:uncharacterized protein YbdZ (MbtH family)